MNGTVKFYTRDGWGFVTGSDQTDYFFHVSDWQSQTDPAKGMAVTFDQADNGKGPKAVGVKPTGEQSEAKTDIAWLRERA